MTLEQHLRLRAKLARARERFERWLNLDVAAELRRVFEQASHADRLEALAACLEREARKRKSGTAKRVRLMVWLGRLKAGENPGNFGRYTEADGRAALAATARGGVAAAAAELTGKSIDLYLDAQRNGSRGKPRNMCRTRKRA